MSGDAVQSSIFEPSKQQPLVLLYNIFIRLYFLAILLASFWNKKAKEWLDGRKNVFTALGQQLSGKEKIIWVHCSSAGEFEQGKPIIERLKLQYPEHKILLSFFSPSGYKVAAKYKHADIVTYLPLDTRQNAKRFISLINPELVIFVKYEFWYHHLSATAFRHIPVLLVSAVFRKDQAFFKRYGKFYRQILYLFRHIFVQDEASLKLLKENGIEHCSISGDTRFDRVQEISEKFTKLPLIEDFIGNARVTVAGSTWGDDERILSSCDTKLIIAPHEINEPHLAHIEKLFKNSIRYSQLQKANSPAQVLIIDNIGMLSRLYYYATIAYVGGGFTKDGIHNILEAAVYGKPVLFGPNYKKYREAKELIETGGAFSVANAGELKLRIDTLLTDTPQLQQVSRAAKNYVQMNTGATQKVLQFIQEKRLLTK
jgi:3-deoxy-D-manno-octulosonic-acid transferase